jgi:hypothetical protein
VTIRPLELGVYGLSPFPFAVKNAEFAFGGRGLNAREHGANGSWQKVLKETPTEWERFRLVPA